MADEIRADYSQLEEIATQFANASQTIQAVQQKVRGSYAKLADKGWIGMGANAFFDEMDSKILPAQERLQSSLEQASQATGRIAHDVKDAEDKASALFRN
jgi:WXG100 family type VII secretion target